MFIIIIIKCLSEFIRISYLNILSYIYVHYYYFLHI